MWIKYKYPLLLLLIVLSATSSRAQKIYQTARKEASGLKVLFDLSMQQEDSLSTLLPAYYKEKSAFLQHPHPDTDDAKRLQAVYDGILKKTFTKKQYLLYEQVKVRHLKLMYQRTKAKDEAVKTIGAPIFPSDY